jgi:outer membrane protein assembly factor BamB
MLKQKWALVGLILLLTVGVEANKIPQEKKTQVKKKEVYKKIWEKSYGGQKDDDIAYGIVALENGESAIVGTCKSFGAERTDICVSRMSADGQMKWSILLGGKKEDEGKAITRSADGNLFILGMTKSLAKDYDRDIYVAKVTLEGKLLWQKAIGGERDENPGGIAGTDDGGVMIVGDTESFGKRYRDIYIAKLSKEGKTVFARTIGGKKTDEAHGLTRMKDGNFALVGMRESSGKGYEEFFAMKIDQNGKSLWTKTFGDYDDDSLESVTATIDGGIVAVGKTRSYGSEQTDLTVMKLSSEGKVLWHKIYGFKYYEYGNAVTMTSDGGFMLAGGTSTLGKGSHSVYMLALDKNGGLIWSHVYGGEDRDIAHAMTRMSDGSVITIGQSESFSRYKSFYMIKVVPTK